MPRTLISLTVEVLKKGVPPTHKSKNFKLELFPFSWKILTKLFIVVYKFKFHIRKSPRLPLGIKELLRIAEK